MLVSQAAQLLLVACLATVTLSLAIRTVLSFRRARSTQVHEVLAAAVGECRRRPPESALASAWEQVPVPLYPEGLSAAARPVYRLAMADPAHLETLFKLAESHVGALNKSVCEGIDNRLISAVDLVRRHAALHRPLLAELSLVVPVVWARSIVMPYARGRLGYRAARLLDILIALRALNPSRSQQVSRVIRVQHQGELFLELPEIGPADTVRTWLRVTFAPPGITMSSKLRQERYRRRLSDELARHGVEVADLAGPTPDLKW